MWETEYEWTIFQGFVVGLELCSIFISGLEENMKLELIKFVNYVKAALSGEAWRRNGLFG